MKPELLSPAGTLKNMRYAFIDPFGEIFMGEFVVAHPQAVARLASVDRIGTVGEKGSMKRMRWAKSFMWWSTLPRITPS
jgi:hypothetical protein